MLRSGATWSQQGHKLTASDGSLTAANSNSFDIIPGAAAKLGFNNGPSDAQTVDVNDGLPAGTSGAMYSLDGGASTPYSTPLALGTVPSGVTHVITITATNTGQGSATGAPRPATVR